MKSLLSFCTRFISLNLLFLVVVSLGFFIHPTSIFATGELPFEDVSPADDYYGDLLSLYKRGIIPMSTDGKFYPNSKMNRDVFVSIVVGVSCKNCLIPSFDDILKYYQRPFVDFEKTNESFYCVSYAKELGIIRGYTLDSTGKAECSDGSTQTETPFCPKNEITRIEAAAVLLRQGGLWNESKNNAPFKKDITFTDVDENWYGYAQKAVQTGLILQDDTGAVSPNEFITKAEFIRMAAKIFRTNICSIRSITQNSSNPLNSNNPLDTTTATGGTQNTNQNIPPGNQDSENLLSSQIVVLAESSKCHPIVTPTSTTLAGNKRTLCARVEGSDGPFSYNWEMFHVGDSTRLTATGASLEPFNFSSTGTWLVRVTITDTVGKSSQSTASIYISDQAANQSASSLQIQASTLSPDLLASVNFNSIVQGGTGPFVYRWDFGDGAFSPDPKPTHAYSIPGPKTVQLVVRDSKGNTSLAQVVIVVEGDDDLDNDGIKNSLDLCPLVFGGEDGVSGCPSIIPYNPNLLGIDGDGSTGTFTRVFDTPGFYGSIELSPTATNSVCHFNRSKDSGAIFGRRQCSACPCSVELDYLAQMRACDIVFPAILSPDKKNVYSRGKVFEVK